MAQEILVAVVPMAVEAAREPGAAGAPPLQAHGTNRWVIVITPYLSGCETSLACATTRRARLMRLGLGGL